MVSIEQQTTVVGLLLFAVLIYKTSCLATKCHDPEYLENLKDEVRPFYTSESSTDLALQGPCSSVDNNQISRPQRPVHTLESWHSQYSTCPWVMHIVEDGSRYPCRIATARLVRYSADDEPENHHHPRACLRVPGVRHNRSENNICKHLLQTVPIVKRTGCRNGINDYAIQNMTINVGFICVFIL